MYEGYLTEDKLEPVLKVLFPNSNIIRQKKFGEKPVNRFRFDYYIESENMVVEYDGDSHFCKGSTNRADRTKDMWCEKKGIKMVRIPYFFQMDRDAVWYFFGIETNNIDGFVEPDFPQGFITKTVTPPSDFNLVGTRMFVKMLGNFATDGPKRLGIEIFESLVDIKVKKRKYLTDKLNMDFKTANELATTEVFGIDPALYTLGLSESLGTYT